jgi:hypothetical protein
METIFNPFERSISFFSARLPTDGRLTLNYDQSWKNSVKIEKFSSALELISNVNLSSAFSSVFRIFATAKEILGRKDLFFFVFLQVSDSFYQHRA